MAEMFIGGEAVELPELERRTIVNPASGQPVDSVPAGTAAEVDRAVQAANAAFLRTPVLFVPRIVIWTTSSSERGRRGKRR